MGRYSVHLVGEANYQAPIAKLSPGDPVSILPEPSNPYDPRALRCADVTGETIGYIERDSWLTRVILDDRTAVSATIEKIIGGTADKPSRGVVLAVLTAADAQSAQPGPLPAAQPLAAAPVAKKKGGCLKAAGIVIAVMFGISLIGAIIGPDEGKPGATPAPAAKATPDAEAAKQDADRKAGFHCLSKWDGSHRDLVRAVEPSLRDPDSFEHIETRITPVNAKGFHLLTMQYRARNGFGGMAIGTLRATVKNSDCSFEILSNESS